MAKKKIFKKRYVVWTLLCLTIGFYLSYRIFIVPNKEASLQKVPVAVHQLSDVKNIFKKLKIKDVLVHDIQQSQELITTEITLEDTITWDESWGNFDIFKKMQRIHISGSGIYTVDLKNINDESITVDNKLKTINIKVPSPKVKTVSIDEEKTKYESVEKGLLRFGDIKLLPEEHQIVMQEAKEKMKSTMLDKKNYEKSKDNSEKILKELIKGITQGYINDDYNVNVLFTEPKEAEGI